MLSIQVTQNGSIFVRPSFPTPTTGKDSGHVRYGQYSVVDSDARTIGIGNTETVLAFEVATGDCSEGVNDVRGTRT